MKVGNSDIEDIKKGVLNINKIYSGSDIIWERVIPADSDLATRILAGTISGHIGDIPLNEMDAFWAKPIGGTPLIYIMGDDKTGYCNMYTTETLAGAATLDKHGDKIMFQNYASTIYHNNMWYMYGSNDFGQYPTASVSYFKCRFSPRNIAYSRRYFPVSVNNGSEYYYDQHISFNPYKNEWVWAFGSIQYQGHSHSRVRTAPTPDGPWEDIDGTILVESLNLPDNTWQHDPRLVWTRDGKAWYTYGSQSNPSGNNSSTAWFNMGICQIDPLTYKEIPGTYVLLWKAESPGGTGQYTYCTEPIPPGFTPTNVVRKLGVQEPTYLEVGGQDYMIYPHTSDKNNAYNFPAGFHYVTLAPHNMGTATPIEFQPDPKADWHFDFTTLNTSSFTSLTGTDAITGECHSPMKELVTPIFDANGLVLDKSYYFQIETSLYSDHYEAEIQLTTWYGDVKQLFGNFPFAREGERKNTIRLNFTRVEIYNEDSSITVWNDAVLPELFANPITIKIVANVTSAELFVNGVSKGVKTVQGKQRLSTIGCGYISGSSAYPPPASFFDGTIHYFKLKDLS